MHTSTAAVIGYGKIPAHGDFVRHNVSGTAVRALDEWLREGLYLAKSGLGRSFDDAYDAAPSYRFLFAPKSGEPKIVGAMRPSRDRSRRTFPFLIAAEADVDSLNGREPAHIPVRFAAFLEEADRRTGDIVTGGIGHREVGSWLEQSGLATAREESTAAYDRFLSETMFASWCERQWGFFGDSRKYLLFRNLLELLGPLSGVVPQGFTLGVRFPLGAKTAPEADVAFWMELCRNLVRLPIETPVCFWTAAAPGGRRGFLLLFFRMPPARALSELLQDGSTGDYVCNLEDMNDAGAAEAALAIPSRIGALLESEDISLREFLDALSVE